MQVAVPGRFRQLEVVPSVYEDLTRPQKAAPAASSNARRDSTHGSVERPDLFVAQLQVRCCDILLQVVPL